MAAEHKRSSLVDDSFDSVGSAKKAKSGGGGSGNTVKVVAAVVILAIAAVVMAVNFNLLPNPFEEKIKPTVRTPEENKAAQDYQKQVETNKTKPNVNQGGS